MSVRRTRLVLGLGNPGAEYDGTRHNVGFTVLDLLAERLGRPFLARGRALLARHVLPVPPSSGSAAARAAGGDEIAVLLAKPTTFMNRSGRAARDLLSEISAPLDLLVVCDDFHLPLGRLRCRARGSAGGQKGLASVIELSGLGDVPRLRLGIGDPGRVPAEEFVLRRFRRGEQQAAARLVERAADVVEAWLAHGDLERLMREANVGNGQR